MFSLSLLLYSPYYDKACNEFAVLISMSQRVCSANLNVIASRQWRQKY